MESVPVGSGRREKVVDQPPRSLPVKCPSTKADVTRLLMGVDISREDRRKLEESLCVALVSARQDGAVTRKQGDVAAIANAALLCTSQDEQQFRRGLLAAKRIVESRSH